MASEFLGVQNGTDAAAGIKADQKPQTQSCCQSNHASALGHICERLLAYKWTIGDQAVPFPDSLLGVFKTANLVTPVFLDQVFNAFGRKQTPKWEVLEQERVATDPLFTKLKIGCRVDGIRHVADKTGRLRPYNVVELKSMNGNMFQSITDVGGLAKTHWTAKYVDQLLLGMLGVGLTENPGWLVIYNKNNLSEVRIFEIPFDEVLCERLLRRAERINAHVAAGTLPDQIRRPDICQSCRFVPMCSPKLVGNPEDAPRLYKKGEDDDLYALLEDYTNNKAERDAHEHAKDKLRERLVPGETVGYGKMVVTWKRHGKGWRMMVVDSSTQG